MQVAVVGEALVDVVERDDGTFAAHLGGSPYNVAIGLAREGVDVGYFSPLSDDRFGDRFRSTLCRENVAAVLPRCSGKPTSLAIVVVDESGAPTYRLYRDGIADKDVEVAEIVSLLPDELEVFHTGSLALTPDQLPQIEQLLDIMDERGVVTSLDINIRLGAVADKQAYLAGVRRMAARADIVKASDEDLEPLQLAADPVAAAAKLAKERGRGLVTLTTGGGGAVLFAPDYRVEKPAYRIDDVVDTVGAGDTFHSAFIAALLHSGQVDKSLLKLSRETLDDALDFACAAAAINVTRPGCSPPTRAEVEAFRSSTQSH